METVIFACVHNAGRSQMAAAFFNALADPSKIVASSAALHLAAARSLKKSQTPRARLPYQILLYRRDLFNKLQKGASDALTH